MLRTQDDFRRSVISRCNVFGITHDGILTNNTPRKSKIANLPRYQTLHNLQLQETYPEFTISIDQQIARFEISMQDIRRVHILETSQELVQKVLIMLVCKRLFRFDDLVEISFHESFNQIHFIETLWIVCICIKQACNLPC